MPLRVCRHRRTRAAAAMMAAVLMALLALSAAAIAVEASHDCTGAECAVCALVRTAVARLVLGGTAVFAAVGLILLLRCCALALNCAGQAAFSFSPVNAKVRLNN